MTYATKLYLKSSQVNYKRQGEYEKERNCVEQDTIIKLHCETCWLASFVDHENFSGTPTVVCEWQTQYLTCLIILYHGIEN